MSGRLAAWVGLVGAISAIGYASRFSGARPERDAVYHWDTAVSELVLFAVIASIVFAIAAGTDWRRLLALRPPRSWRQAVGIGIAVIVAVGILGQLLDPVLHAGREQGLAPHGWRAGHAAPFAANVLALAVVGPIVEELTFRGLGFGLLERYGRRAAILLVGIAFGVWHGLVEALPILVALGIGLAYVRARADSVYPTIVLHSAFNAVALAVAVTT